MVTVSTVFKPYLWSRYIDDIFFFWEYGEEKLKLFIGNINNIYPTIKFKTDWSKHQQMF